MRAGFDIVTMEAEHLDLVVEAAVKFYAESNMRDWLTVNTDKYRAMLAASLGQPDVRSIMVMSCNQVVGYTHISFQDECTDERVGEMYQFYVREEWRGTGVARALLGAAVNQYIAWDCKRAYAEAAAGLDDPRQLKMFGNLFAKFGYKPIGVAFMKDFK